VKIGQIVVAELLKKLLSKIGNGLVNCPTVEFDRVVGGISNKATLPVTDVLGLYVAKA
jgi:hypothetical protein